MNKLKNPQRSKGERKNLSNKKSLNLLYTRSRPAYFDKVSQSV
nr:MAG TPA: hypothetical protein [Caudoviricetes sp.]